MKHGFLLLLAGLVGVLCALIPRPLIIFPVCLYLGVTSALALRNLPNGERIAWGVGLCAVASITATVFSRFFFLVGMFWFPWFVLFVLPVVSVGWQKLPLVKQVGMALVLAPLLYLGTAMILFHFWGGQISPYTETRDRQQREPAVGPAVSWLTYVISPPQGPCCVLSCDYNGNEWVWKVYRPLVKLWFDAPGCRYYDPDKAPVAR